MAPHSSTLAWKIPGTGGALWAAVYGVAQSRTRLKQLSSSSSSNTYSNFLRRFIVISWIIFFFIWCMPLENFPRILFYIQLIVVTVASLGVYPWSSTYWHPWNAPYFFCLFIYSLVFSLAYLLITTKKFLLKQRLLNYCT